MKAVPWQVYVYLWMSRAWSFRYLIAALLVVTPILGFGVGVVRPKHFESTMTVLIQESAKHNPFLEDLAVETRVGDRIAALQALLHSRHVLLGVATDLGWVSEETDNLERERILENLSAALKMRLVGDELVELRYRQKKPAEIDKVLIAVAQRFMDKVLAPERSSITGSQKFLTEQIMQSEAALTEAEAQLAVFKSKHAASMPELHTGNVRRLAEMRMALSEKSTALEGAEARYKALLERLAQNNPIVAQVEQQIVQISADLATLRSRYTELHSAVQAAERKLSRLRSERDAMLMNAPELTEAEIEKIWTAAAQSATPETGLQILLVSQIESLHDAKVQVIDLRRQREILEREVETLDKLVVRFGEIETQLERLQSDVAVKREVHASLKQRAEMAQVTGALGRFEAPERVKVIDHPTIPTHPVGLPPLIYAIAGLFISIFGAIGLIAASEVVDDSFRTSADLVRLSDLPVLVRVPYLPSALPAGFDTSFNRPKWAFPKFKLSRR